MNIIFLRGSVPPSNEHPEKLYYTNIDNCEDVWTQMFYFLAEKLFQSQKKIGNKNKHQSELLYANGDRTFQLNDFFTEKWVPSLKYYTPNFSPDLIICRGGFPYYDDFVARFPKAKKVYYGAGIRFYPQTNFTNYDLFLVDSPKQFSAIKKKGKNVQLLIKPASTLFKPIKTKKLYDICFMANATQAKIKRHELFLRSFAHSKLKILALGNTDQKYIRLAKQLHIDITWNGWTLRKELPAKICQCKIGVCCSTNQDSCPRVIPEYLACNLPIVVTNNVNFWQQKYITPQTGILAQENKISEVVENCLKKCLNPMNYYRDHLSMDKAVEHLANLINAL